MRYLKIRFSQVKMFLEDYFFAALFQFLNILTPFIAVFYLTPIIGKELYANVILISSISTYFKLLYDYGFEYFAAKKISNVSSNNFRSLVFSSITRAKLLLIVVSILPQLFLSYILVIDKDWFFILSYVSGMVFLGLTPYWYFTAVQRFKSLAIVNIAVQAGFIFSLVSFIGVKEDWNLFGLCFAVGQGLGFVVGNILVLKSGIIYISSRNLTKYFLFKSFSLMSFNFMSNIYVSSSVLVLKLFNVPGDQITDFGIAEKIVRGIRQLIAPITRILYPRLAQLYIAEKQNYFRFLKRTTLVIALLGIMLMLPLNIWASSLYSFLNFSINDTLIRVTSILSIILLIGSLGGFLSHGYMVIRNMEASLLRVMFLSILIYLSINALLTPIFGSIGAATAVIACETWLLISILYLYNRDDRC